MAMISSLWDTLIGNKHASGNKATKADSVDHNHNHIHLEKRKLVATRTRLVAQSTNKLDLNHLRARIDSESPDYVAMRERQHTSRSRWFGQRSNGIDEAALTKRLAAPSPKLSQEELELGLNFGDIHLPDHYESQVIYAEPADTLECAIDTADFSDMAADFMDIALMPRLVALSDNIPELDELLARLQVVEALERQEELREEAQEAQEAAPGQAAALRTAVHHPDLHLVTPFETCLPAPVNSPVPMIKLQGKGKKGRRARSKEAAKMKNGTRN